MAKSNKRMRKPQVTRYPSIEGPHFDVYDQPCLAFAKYDGSNLQFKWSQKEGWFQFGTRKRTIDTENPLFGSAIPLFMSKYANQILECFRKHKEYRNAKSLVAFCEFFGENTFSGLHRDRDPKDIKLFDIQIPDAGFVLPQNFQYHFGHLDIAEVVYDGPLTKQFARDVYDGKYPVIEGVVAKGVTKTQRRKGKTESEVWMAKIKTKTWLAELEKRAGETPGLKQELQDNINEQAANVNSKPAT